MRRMLIALLVLGSVTAAAVLLTRSDTSRYRVAAIFDTAKGMVAGQQVKIAGAVAGRVDRVELAPGLKARLVLSVDRRFAPFRQDATCRILPEGLISENFVSCNPGSPTAPPLRRTATLPTVPLTQTAVPTSLQDVLNVFALPTDDRIRALVNELGIATAGRGDDLNALLRRANPALAQSTRLLQTVNRQRDRLGAAVSQTDRIVAALAHRGRAVRTFVDDTAAVMATTGERHDAVAASVRRLPALLDATRPALRSLDRAATQGTPLLESLHASAPALSRVTRDLPPFAAAASRTLTALSPVTDTALGTVRTASPLARHLQTAAAGAVPFAQRLSLLLRNTRDRGGIEGILRWLYSVSAAASAYDGTSHMAGIMLRVLPQCIASATAPGCSTKYDAPGNGTIPPDDPSCGPQNGAPWDPPTTCAPQSPTRRGPRHAKTVRPVTIPIPHGLPGIHLPPVLPRGTPKSGGPIAPPSAPAAGKAISGLLNFLLGS